MCTFIQISTEATKPSENFDIANKHCCSAYINIRVYRIFLLPLYGLIEKVEEGEKIYLHTTAKVF